VRLTILEGKDTMRPMTRQFRVVVEDRDADGWIVAECPDLPGCVSQGRTEREAIDNIKDAIRASLKTRRDHGLPLHVDSHICAIEVEVPA